MRSTDPTDATPAERFGQLIYAAAIRAGYDLSPRGGGRTALAQDSGMAVSAVGRMLDGKTLPRPSQFEAIARAVGIPVRDLLIEAEIISTASWPETTSLDVRSSDLTPEAAADAWGITNHVARQMLISSINQAIRLQQEADQGNGGVTARR